jgi:hypothetical protein
MPRQNTIQLRKGTLSQWTANNTQVLASGEPAFEVDTLRLKIGDGTTAWSGLNYVGLAGTGTSGYLPKFNSSQGVTNSLIFDNGTSVGINTVNPSGKFHIESAVANNSYVLLSNPGNVIKTHIGVGNSDTVPFLASTNDIQLASGNNGWGFFDRGTDGHLQIQRKGGSSSWSSVMTMNRTNGNIGIGTGVQATTGVGGAGISEKLVVDGNIRLADTTVTQGNVVQFNRGGGGQFDYSIGRYGNLPLAISLSNDSSSQRPLQVGYHSGVTFLPKFHVNGYTGDVGIGTTTPSGQLHVIGNGIFSSGVGVGINAPLDLIHISGSSLNAQGIRIDNGDGYGGSIQADNNALVMSSPTAVVCRLQASKIRMGNGTSSTAIELTSSGSISQDGNGGGLTFSGTTAQFSNGINVTNSGIFSSGIVVGNGTVSNPSIVFDGSRTTGFSATSTLLEVSVLGNRAMRISQFGTVAINRGTASALGTLHVQGNGSNPANTSDPIVVTSSVGSGSIIRFTDSASNDWQIGVNPNGSIQSGSGSGNFSITKIVSNSGLPYLTINNSGNVGIGTTSPTANLHVNGSGLFTSGLTSSGTINLNNELYINRSGIFVASSQIPAIKISGYSGDTYTTMDSVICNELNVNDNLYLSTSVEPETSPGLFFSTNGGGVAGISSNIYGDTVYILANNLNNSLVQSATFDAFGINTQQITAEQKFFKIKHPDPESGYSHLQYGSLESPYNGVRLTGKDKLNKGVCEVYLPNYLKHLIYEEDISIQLTNYGHHKILYVDKIDLKNNKFIVKGYRSKSGGPFNFYWSFTGIRKDVSILIPEQ